MLIFNITFLVNDNRVPEWLDWVRNEHIPFMLESGDFTESQLARVMSHQQDGSISYSVQYRIADLKSLERWNHQYGTQLSGDCRSRFGEEVLFFSTTLKILT